MIIGYGLYNTYLGDLLRLLLWTSEWSDFENLHVHLEIVECDIQNRRNRCRMIIPIVQIVYIQTSFTSVQTTNFWKVVQNVLLGWWITEFPIILAVLVLCVLHSDVSCIDQDFCIFFVCHLCHYIHCVLTFSEFFVAILFCKLSSGFPFSSVWPCGFHHFWPVWMLTSWLLVLVNYFSVEFQFLVLDSCF